MSIDFIHEIMFTDDVVGFNSILNTHQYDINKVFIETDYQQEDFFTMAAKENAHKIIRELIVLKFDFQKSFDTQGDKAIQHMLIHGFVDSLRAYHLLNDFDVVENYKSYCTRYFNPLDNDRLVDGNIFDSLIKDDHSAVLKELFSLKGMDDFCLGEDSAYDYFKKLIKEKNTKVFKIVFESVCSKLSISTNRLNKLIGFSDKGGCEEIKAILESYWIGLDVYQSNLGLPLKNVLKM